MAKDIKCILVDVDNLLISEIEEVDAELGNPNCKLINPVVFESLEKMKPLINLDENGFVQYFKDLKNKRFIFIDTNLADEDKGYYCEDRQAWLNKTLNQTSYDQDIYIFMHHNPLALVKEETDEIGLQQKEEFKKILLSSKKNIKHIFFGHQHLTSSGSYCNITFSSPRSTWLPLISNFSNQYRLGTANTDTNYNVAIIRSDATIIHTEDFLKTEVNWIE